MCRGFYTSFAAIAPVAGLRRVSAVDGPYFDIENPRRCRRGFFRASFDLSCALRESPESEVDHSTHCDEKEYRHYDTGSRRVVVHKNSRAERKRASYRRYDIRRERHIVENEEGRNRRCDEEHYPKHPHPSSCHSAVLRIHVLAKRKEQRQPQVQEQHRRHYDYRPVGEYVGQVGYAALSVDYTRAVCDGESDTYGQQGAYPEQRRVGQSSLISDYNSFFHSAVSMRR